MTGTRIGFKFFIHTFFCYQRFLCQGRTYSKTHVRTMWSIWNCPPGKDPFTERSNAYRNCYVWGNPVSTVCLKFMLEIWWPYLKKVKIRFIERRRHRGDAGEWMGWRWCCSSSGESISRRYTRPRYKALPDWRFRSQWPLAADISDGK